MAAAYHGEVLPTSCRLVGQTWLIEHLSLDLKARALSCLSEKRLSSQRTQKGRWLVFDAQIKVEATVFGHLEFYLKYEDLDLLVIKSILRAWPKEELLKHLRKNPKKVINKKIWFLYEFLFDERLALDDLPVGKYDDLLDPIKYVVKNTPLKSKRHKVNNNLIGTFDFCPVVRKTSRLKAHMDKDLDGEIAKVIGSVPGSIMRRAASFLLLSDSKASFEIEGERPPKNRIERWGKIIDEAGKRELSIDEIQRLHAILLENSRFTKIGLRDEGVFLGDRDRDGTPVPEFIGAKSEDLELLMNSWSRLDHFLREDRTDPIIHAVIIAFSFVYIHPLEDGNGRIHRYLLHHVLAQTGFYPKGMVFPISNVILDEIERYRDILVAHSSPLMESIQWESTDQSNVKVLNQTVDLYRFFDCTEACEFIYQCVEKTIKKTLPEELHYLRSFDDSYKEIADLIEMPDNKIKNLITFILQNEGLLSNKKREKFFPLIETSELEKIQGIVKENFTAMP